ncbi:MAG: hypothetical protein RMM17_05775 [Acidobacteriota bacterium]|nr:hypothetical protein [Blastocatellia bacterium]MDW8412175.1 hypothetical protein [Acidobacteriota bacterium]
MKRLTRVIMVLLLSFTIGYAGDKTEKIEIPADVTINGVQVKKGNYEYSFDEATGKFVLFKGKKVIAEATAKAEPRKSRVKGTELIVIRQENTSLLKGLVLPGQDKAIIIEQNLQTTKPQ